MTLFSDLAGFYRQLVSSTLSAEEIKEKVRLKRQLMSAATRLIIQNPKGYLELFHPEDIKAYAELKAVLLLSYYAEEQYKIFQEFEGELWAVLESGAEKAYEFAGSLISFIILSLDDFPQDLKNSMLQILGSLTGRQEGIKEPIEDRVRSLPHGSGPRLSQLLDMGLASEVFSFLNVWDDMSDASNKNDPLGIGVPVVTVLSRKGGVGKSTITLALLLWYLENSEGGRACIVDLDVTGPVWQYLIAPKGVASDGSPLSYLNSIINIEQHGACFDFGRPSREAALSCASQISLSQVEKEVGLVTLADWPRTNRYLIEAISNNRASYSEFLEYLLKGLSSEYDFIVIDNSPGFDTQSLLTLALVGQMKKGWPLVISTPFMPDLRGTLLELSDFRLLPSKRPPTWIINKASEQVVEFFSQPHTLIEIAAETRSYSDILPQAPLLGRTLRRYRAAANAVPLPFDPTLVSVANLMETSFAEEGVIDAVRSSVFYKKMHRFLGDNSPLSTWTRLGGG